MGFLSLSWYDNPQILKPHGPDPSKEINCITVHRRLNAQFLGSPNSPALMRVYWNCFRSDRSVPYANLSSFQQVWVEAVRSQIRLLCTRYPRKAAWKARQVWPSDFINSDRHYLLITERMRYNRHKLVAGEEGLCAKGAVVKWPLLNSAV